MKKFTVRSLLMFLDGNGIVIENIEEVEKSLKQISVFIDESVVVNQGQIKTTDKEVS